MKSKLLRNWEAKLIALGLATVVWFLVKANRDRSVAPASAPAPAPAAQGQGQGQGETGRSAR